MAKIDVLDVPTCRKCGLPTENCECNRFHYRFKGVVAPFLYEDAVKKALNLFDDDESQINGKNILAKIEELKNGDETATLIIQDPFGQSNIVSDKAKVLELKANINKTNTDRKDARKFSKEEMDKHAYFNRAAKVYLDAEKLMKQKDNYSHFEEIEKMYDDAKARIEA